MHKNILKDNILFLSILLAFLAFCFYGCKKEEEAVHFTNLTTLPRIVRVGDTSGSAIIKLYTNGDWKAALNDKAGWVTLNEKDGSGKENLGVSFKSNKGKLPRSTKLFITSDNKTDSVFIIQGGLIALNATVDTLESYAKGGMSGIRLSPDTNVPDSLISETVAYADGGQSKWISGFSFVNDSLKFNISQSESSNSRSAIIYLSFKGPLKDVIADSIRVIQKSIAESAQLKSFSFIKDTLSSGAITENIYIQGVIISDEGNPNMGRNPNLSKTKIDKSVNKETVYLQSMDGKSGIKILTATPDDNVFKRNDVVKLWLKGLSLAKNQNPAFVVLKNVSETNILAKQQSAVPLVPRELYMKELSDSDIFTYVKLKDVEISIPDGSFFNINEGYKARVDLYPTNIRGIYGNSMYMLLNMDVPWRRDGNHVPEGSGTISGIIVHADLSRYGNDIGAYSIRPLERSDIQLSADREDGFSKTLVRWSRYKVEYRSSPTLSQNPLTPDVGNGSLTQSAHTILDFSNKGIYPYVDFNGLDANVSKGTISNGAWRCVNWWDYGKNEGAYWLIKVSTAGISTPISLQFDGASQIGGPRNFVVEWSSTGDVGSWNKVGNFTLQDEVNWGNTLYSQVAGFKELNFQFPIAASGLPDLYIRLRVTDDIAGTTTGSDNGTIGSNKGSYCGYVSIKYNK